MRDANQTGDGNGGSTSSGNYPDLSGEEMVYEAVIDGTEPAASLEKYAAQSQEAFD